MSGGDFDLIGPGEAGRLMGVSAITIRRYAKEGRIPTAEMTRGGHHRFRRRVIEAIAAGEDPWEADKRGKHVPITT